MKLEKIKHLEFPTIENMFDVVGLDGLAGISRYSDVIVFHFRRKDNMVESISIDVSNEDIKIQTTEEKIGIFVARIKCSEDVGIYRDTGLTSFNTVFELTTYMKLIIKKWLTTERPIRYGMWY